MPENNKWIAWLLRFFGMKETDAALPPLQPEDVALHRLLFLLLPALETQGMTLSPDRYIRLKRLMAALPRNTRLADWRNYLCPLFATDETRQHAFYALFDQILIQIELKTEPDSDIPEKENRPETTQPASPAQSPKPAQPAPFSQPAAPAARRPLVVELDECTDPPYSWNIISEKENVPVETGPAFGKTVLQLRRRETAEYALPDLPASVRATIAEGGVPTFRYRYPTRPTEYLLLVERHALDDHRAGLFDFFYQSLRDNEVFIERFFYQGDLRICRNERHPGGLNLGQLRYRYPDARLVVMGAGYRFISPKSGDLSPWTQALSGWRRRVLLTPVSRHDWGQREQKLQDIFTLLPASFQSLHYLSAAPDEALHGSYDALPEYIRRIAETQPVEITAPALSTLRRHFDPGTLCWIAACAVYPALHFELTLRLGRLLSASLGYNLLSAANLLALARLPWFTAGQIPAPVRTELLEYLERRHPEQHLLVLDYLRQLLEDNPPPEHSVAWAEHRINLALLKAMRDPAPDPDTLQQLRAVVKRLDRPEKRGDFVLPASWEALLGKFDWEEPDIELDKSTTEGIKPKTEPLKTFIIYTREDTQYCDELRRWLRPLEVAGRIKVWSDREIAAGVLWEQEIRENLNTADIILILVSAAYYNSEYIHEVEIKYALSRHEKGEAMLLPVIVRPCSFADDPVISRLQVLPTDAKPVNSSYWLNRDDAWRDVTDGIKRAIDSILEEKPAGPKNGAPLRVPFLSGSGHAPEMLFVQGGEFRMGSDDTEAESDEKPVHPVRLDDFYMGKYAVTVAEYMTFADETKSHNPEWLESGSDYNIKTGKDDHYRKLGDALQNENNPIVGISWNDAAAYCEWLSQKTGRTYRLPTEAEWEYAARGGNQSKGFKYAGSNKLDEVAWYSDNSKSKTHSVGLKKPNELGLYDMSGNVWEWCEDDWHGNYEGAPVNGSAWINSPRGDDRVYRGGSWSTRARNCRAAYRLNNAPSYRYSYLGFRLVLSP